MHECNTKALGKDSGETDYALTERRKGSQIGKEEQREKQRRDRTNVQGKEKE